MKRMYTAPKLTEFGALERITLGTGGSVPDYVGANNINNNCVGATFTQNGSTYSITSCNVAAS